MSDSFADRARKLVTEVTELGDKEGALQDVSQSLIDYGYLIDAMRAKRKERHAWMDARRQFASEALNQLIHAPSVSGSDAQLARRCIQIADAMCAEFFAPFNAPPIDSLTEADWPPPKGSQIAVMQLTRSSVIRQYSEDQSLVGFFMASLNATYDVSYYWKVLEEATPDRVCGQCSHYHATSDGPGVCSASPAALTVSADDSVETADHYGVPCPYFKAKGSADVKPSSDVVENPEDPGSD